jgi:hypothetical protein
VKLEQNQEAQYYKNQPFSVWKDGRFTKLVTSDTGTLSIPLSTILPTDSLEVHFYPHGVTEPPVKTEIPISKILSGEIEFTYIVDDNKILVASNEKRSVIPDIFRFDMISTAMAGEDVEQNQIAISEFVIDRIKSILKNKTNNISLDTKLSSLYISPPRRAYLYAELEDKYNVVVWSEIWGKAETVGDLVQVLRIATGSETGDSTASPAVNATPVVNATSVVENSSVVNAAADTNNANIKGSITTLTKADSNPITKKVLPKSIDPMKFKMWKK